MTVVAQEPGLPPVLQDPTVSLTPLTRATAQLDLDGPGGSTQRDPSASEQATCAGSPDPRFQPEPTDDIEGETLLGSASLPEGVDVSAIAQTPMLFHLRDRIGIGGQGEVWEAIHNSLHRRIAVKVLHEKYYRGHSVDDASRRLILHLFRREAQLMALLDHPNIVPIYDFVDNGADPPTLAMKRIDGETWDRQLRQDSALEAGPFLARHLPILVDVAQAIAFAHSRGVCHLDLKPSQVLIGAYGEVLVTDWGLARVFDRERLEHMSGTVCPPACLFEPRFGGEPFGTPCYMAPEQAKPGTLPVGPATDVYLVGATLFHLLTGSPPHDGKSSELAITQATEGKIAGPEACTRDWRPPEELMRIALDCLQFDPGDRPQSVESIIDRLKSWLDGSTRRLEAETILYDVENLFALPVKTYEILTDCMNRLERAQALAPDLERASKLRLKVLDTYCREALARGDLSLARNEAYRLVDASKRSKLLDEINQAERDKSARERQRLIGLVIIAVLPFAALIFSYLNMQQTTRAEVAELKVRARAEMMAFDRAVAALQRDESELAARVLTLYSLPKSPADITLPAPRDETAIALHERFAAIEDERLRLQRQDPDRAGHPCAAYLLARATLLSLTAQSNADLFEAFSLYDRLRDEIPGEPSIPRAMEAVANAAGFKATVTP